MVFDLKKYEKRIRNAQLNKASFMSNSKWRKFFESARSRGLQYHGNVLLKCLRSEEAYPFGLDVWIDEKHPGYTMDGRYPPLALKEIEWIFIPADYEIERWHRDEKLQPKYIKNDIHALKEMIDELGFYEYDFNINGIKIYGYK